MLCTVSLGQFLSMTQSSQITAKKYCPPLFMWMLKMQVNVLALKMLSVDQGKTCVYYCLFIFGAIPQSDQ